MGRRRKSIFEDLAKLTAMFPWWVGIALALISYLLLHNYAGTQIEPMTNTAQMGNFVVRQMMVTGARILQYLLPVFLVLGAITSFIQKQKKEKLYGNIKKNPAIRSLKEMSWQEFELLVGKYFEEKGYTVKQLSHPGPDGGIDLVAIKDNEKYLVQCKQWRSTSVGVKVVRELLGVIVSSGAAGGFVVSSGEFTRDARVL